MSEVLSGCAVRAVIQMEKAPDDSHYLGAIKLRLERLYELTEAPNLREQISDEISWVEEKLGEALSTGEMVHRTSESASAPIGQDEAEKDAPSTFPHERKST